MSNSQTNLQIIANYRNVMQRFWSIIVGSFLPKTKKDLSVWAGPFHYIIEFNYSSTAACAAAYEN